VLPLDEYIETVLKILLVEKKIERRAVKPHNAFPFQPKNVNIAEIEVIAIDLPGY
jgi:hypothetical protein